MHLSHLAGQLGAEGGGVGGAEDELLVEAAAVLHHVEHVHRRRVPVHHHLHHAQHKSLLTSHQLIITIAISTIMITSANKDTNWFARGIQRSNFNVVP